MQDKSTFKPAVTVEMRHYIKAEDRWVEKPKVEIPEKDVWRLIRKMAGLE